MTEANNYEYNPLSGTRDIRIISLCPGVGDEPVLLNIEHTSLNQKPTYEALSYVWGPQIPSYLVRCNNAHLLIGGNLKDALQSLRKPDAHRILWIDRIAINQEDIHEREQQVTLMGDIYSSASIVVVWLGAADDQNVKSYEEAHTMKDHFQYPSLEAPVWTAIKSLLQRPWFSRVWTFQEIVLAHKAVLYCGSYDICWSRLEVFLVGLNAFSQGSNVEDSRLKGAEREAMEILKARVSLQRIGTKLEEPQLFLSLLPLLDSLRLRQATDPRDKVFALLNVACDAKDSDLKPEYRKRPAEVYAMTAKWLLKTQKRLDFLSLVEIKDKPDIISWVPDLRQKDHWNFLHQPSQIFRGKHRIYNTSGSTNATILDIESTYQLTVSGICVGTIVSRTMPPGNLTNNVSIGTPVLDGGQWHSFARTCAENGFYRPTRERIDLAYHRLRIWDQVPNEGVLGRRHRASPITSIPQPGSVSYASNLDSIVYGAKIDIGMAILSKTTRKRMFKTDSGYLGIAHRSVEVGDKVYVIMGGETPFVLRPFGGSYFGFGGESYVHGIMDGEMLGIARSGGKDYKDVHPGDLAWIDELGDEPWPFEVEKLILV